MKQRETRVVNKIFNSDDKDDKRTYHHFILEEVNNQLYLYFLWEGESQEISKEKMENITFPMEYVPQYVGMLIQAYSSEKNPDDLMINDSIYSVGSMLNERDGVIRCIRLAQEWTNNEDFVLIDLEWNTVTIPWDVTKRVMPESLAWLISNLKELYNEWQETHSNKLE